MPTMRIDFRDISNVDSFINIPPGRYVCEVSEVKDGQDGDGSPRWILRLQVAEGELAGRLAGWDFLHWSERGLTRVRDVLQAFGVDTEGIVDIEPSDLCGRRAWVSFVAETKERGDRVIHTLNVPYRGYEPLSEATLD